MRYFLLGVMMMVFSRSLNSYLIRGSGKGCSGRRGMVSAISGSNVDEDKLVKVPSGLIAVYKPQGWTSSDVVGKVRNILRNGAKKKANRQGKVKIKVGHGGTLDPLAEGVLVLGVGEGTKMLQAYLTGAKSYYAEAKLGSETDTLDSTGTVTSIEEWSHVTRADLDNALEHFRGNISQVPPMYSALKRDGKKLYELARKGIEVEREAREITIYELERGQQELELPMFSLDVSCSGGTYIRTLCADIARHVNTRAHMTSLLRTKQGPFALKDCLHFENWDYDSLCSAVNPMAPDLKAALTLEIEQPCGEQEH